MRKDQNGYIVVETVGAFTLFILLIASILSLVNIVVVQARVHNAMTQAAQTFSMYSYVLEVTGVADTFAKLDSRASEARKEANEFQTEIGGIIDGINGLSADEIKNHSRTAYGKIEGWMDNPKETIGLILSFSLNEGKNAVFGEAAQVLVGRYLENGDLSGDEYLKSANVIGGLEGLRFYGLDDSGGNDSVLIDSEGNVRLVVQYEIEYKFGALPLPFEPKLTLKVTQIVSTKAWLNGSGKGYH